MEHTCVNWLAEQVDARVLESSKDAKRWWQDSQDALFNADKDKATDFLPVCKPQEPGLR